MKEIDTRAWLLATAELVPQVEKIDLGEAQKELRRIDQYLLSPTLLVGGLAVQQYCPTRRSQDLDLVTDDVTVIRLIDTVYPSSEWHVTDSNSDVYRPAFVIKHKFDQNRPIVYLGPKMIERGSYAPLEWKFLYSESRPFRFGRETLTNVVVPSPETLCASKVLSFLNRSETHPDKAKRDLIDMVELSNLNEFRLGVFYNFIRQLGLQNRIASEFAIKASTFDSVFEQSYLSGIGRLFRNGPTVPPPSFGLNANESVSGPNVNGPGKETGALMPLAEIGRVAMNPIAREFSDQFADAFPEHILPAEGRFDEEQAPLYISQRKTLKKGECSVACESSEAKWGYEELLNGLFWDTRIKVIFIEGEVGVGKSTLIDFYLRSYCPSHGKEKYDYRRKLIINCDLRACHSKENFDSKIYFEIRKSITRYTTTHGLDLISHNSYAMWNPKFEWQSSVHNATQRQTPNEVLDYRAACVREILPQISDKEYVQVVLRYLSELLSNPTRAAPGLPLYIVLVFDNLDQSPFELQDYAVSTLREMIRDHGAFYKAFVPVWPTTLSRLKTRHHPQPSYWDSFLLGPPRIDRVINSRTDVLLKEVTHGVKFEGQLISASKCREFINSLAQALPLELQSLMEKDFGGSARRGLEIWEELLSSKVLFNAFISRQHPSRYAVCCALIRGTQLANHRENSRIPNVFYSLSQVNSCRDFLIGFHFCYAVARGLNSMEKLHPVLGDIGYSIVQIMECAEYFRRKGFLEWFSITERNEFRPSLEMFHFLQELIENAAYADEMALVTPVSGECLQKGQFTNPWDITQFFTRASTTLSFIEEVRDQERSFCREGKSLKNFILQLSQMRFPSASRLLLRSYRERLMKLRGQDLLKDSANDWLRLLEHPLIQSATVSSIELIDFLLKEDVCDTSGVLLSSNKME